MENNLVILIGIAVLGLTAVAAFVAYRRRQRERVRQVKHWIEEYLLARFGRLPDRLNINCSDDAHWPVLVAFNHPDTGIRQNLQFTCPGHRSTWSLLAEREGKS